MVPSSFGAVVDVRYACLSVGIKRSVGGAKHGYECVSILHFSADKPKDVKPARLESASSYSQNILIWVIIPLALIPSHGRDLFIFALVILLPHLLVPSKPMNVVQVFRDVGQ